MNTLQLSRRFREVILDRKWIANTNFKDELQNLDWQLANQKVGNLHIVSLLFHHVHD